MGQYINLRGHQVFNYEWTDNGEAVLLLHGGLSQTSHWDASILPAVQNNFHVFAYDRTGHGFTGDQAGSFHFNYQLQEVIAYLEDVIKEPAHLIGFSDGGIIALMVAIKRPELVKSIVAIGANFHHSGAVSILEDWNPSDEDRAEYAITSPYAPHTMDEKIKKMRKIWASEPNISLADIAKIACPVLVLVGDDDVIKHSHSIELYETLPLGQFAVIPGTSHILPKEKPGLVNAVILQFLADLSYPITKMPIRRTNPIID